MLPFPRATPCLPSMTRLTTSLAGASGCLVATTVTTWVPWATPEVLTRDALFVEGLRLSSCNHCDHPCQSHQFETLELFSFFCHRVLTGILLCSISDKEKKIPSPWYIIKSNTLLTMMNITFPMQFLPNISWLRFSARPKFFK